MGEAEKYGFRFCDFGHVQTASNEFHTRSFNIFALFKRNFEPLIVLNFSTVKVFPYERNVYLNTRFSTGRIFDGLKNLTRPFVHAEPLNISALFTRKCRTRLNFNFC